MQTHGYVIINGEKIKVLVRQQKYWRTMRIRQSGKDGTHFSAEEDFLNLPESQEIVSRLRDGWSVNT